MDIVFQASGRPGNCFWTAISSLPSNDLRPFNVTQGGDTVPPPPPFLFTHTTPINLIDSPLFHPPIPLHKNSPARDSHWWCFAVTDRREMDEMQTTKKTTTIQTKQCNLTKCEIESLVLYYSTPGWLDYGGRRGKEEKGREDTEWMGKMSRARIRVRGGKGEGHRPKKGWGCVADEDESRSWKMDNYWSIHFSHASPCNFIVVPQFGINRIQNYENPPKSAPISKLNPLFTSAKQ